MEAKRFKVFLLNAHHKGLHLPSNAGVIEVDLSSQASMICIGIQGTGSFT